MRKRQDRRDRLLVALALPLAVLLLATPLILSKSVVGRQGFDHLNYHLPAIRIFAHDWPHFDLVGYLSATTPGYHLALAAFARFVSGSEVALRFAGSTFTLALVGVLAWACTARRAGVGLACAAAFAASPYAFTPAAFLLPDNAGWLFVLLSLLVALSPRLDWGSMVLGGIVLAALVFVRQSHAWAAAPLLVAAWIHPREAEAPLGDLLRPTPARAGRALAMLLATAPAAAIVAWFAWRWHGLLPPLFQTQYRPADGHAGVTPGAPAFVLALTGIYGTFFVGTIWEGLAGLWARSRPIVWATLAIALVFAVIPATTYRVDGGRWDTLWKVTGRGPVLLGHVNVLLGMLAVAGALALAGLFARVDTRTRWILGSALAGFAATQVVSFVVFQRYAEPMVLMTLALLASRAGGTPAHERRRLGPDVLGPTLLAAVLAALTGLKLSREAPDHRLPADQLMREVFPNAPASLTPRLEPDEPRRTP